MPAGALLGALEVGQVEAFVHESLGSEGSPSSLFLGYLAYRDDHSGVLYRAGLIELPLVHSPAQRNDTLTTYGYEGALVGLNDLTLATTRWALEAERDVGKGRIAATVAFANGGGSAYGGKPESDRAAPKRSRSPSSASSRASGSGQRPARRRRAVGLAPDHARRTAPFDDPYSRVGISLEARRGRLELLAEQWCGRDHNGDGTGRTSTRTAASRGCAGGSAARLRRRARRRAADADRARTLLWYAEAHVTPHARV